MCMCVIAAMSGGLNELQIAFVSREILKVREGGRELLHQTAGLPTSILYPELCSC